MFISKKTIGLLALVVFILIAVTVFSVPIMTVLSNVQISGKIFGKASQFSGERTWGYTGTADTLVVTSVDTTCAVFITPKTATGTLRYDIHFGGDTIFVTSTGSETADTDKYSYFIIFNAYDATD